MYVHSAQDKEITSNIQGNMLDQTDMVYGNSQDRIPENPLETKLGITLSP